MIAGSVYNLLMQNIQNIAEQLLNRSLNKRDGLSKTLIEITEKRLGFALPPALRSFYLKIGNNERFSQSFSRFLMLDDLLVAHDKLIFLAENQHVCSWAFDVNDINKQKLTVYQTQNEGEFFNEQIDLAEFIRINLYYQLAQGGYEHCATIQVEEEHNFAQVLQCLATDKSWQKVVDHNHLVIYCNKSQLIWYLTNQDAEIHEMIFASTLLKKDLNALIRQFGFSDLG
jgi:hypothetical protein